MDDIKLLPAICDSTIDAIYAGWRKQQMEKAWQRLDSWLSPARKREYAEIWDANWERPAAELSNLFFFVAQKLGAECCVSTLEAHQWLWENHRRYILGEGEWK